MGTRLRLKSPAVARKQAHHQTTGYRSEVAGVDACNVAKGQPLQALLAMNCSLHDAIWTSQEGVGPFRARQAQVTWGQHCVISHWEHPFICNADLRLLLP